MGCRSKYVFYVDTTKDPPQSLWEHPYDNFDYVKSLPEDAPVRQWYIQQYIEEKNAQKNGGGGGGGGGDPRGGGGEANGSAGKKEKEGKRSLGRMMKDKVTGKSHAQREEERTAREHEVRSRRLPFPRLRGGLRLTNFGRVGAPALPGVHSEAGGAPRAAGAGPATVCGAEHAQPGGVVASHETERVRLPAAGRTWRRLQSGRRIWVWRVWRLRVSPRFFFSLSLDSICACR